MVATKWFVRVQHRPRWGKESERKTGERRWATRLWRGCARGWNWGIDLPAARLLDSAKMLHRVYAHLYPATYEKFKPRNVKFESDEVIRNLNNNSNLGSSYERLTANDCASRRFSDKINSLGGTIKLPSRNVKTLRLKELLMNAVKAITLSSQTTH